MNLDCTVKDDKLTIVERPLEDGYSHYLLKEKRLLCGGLLMILQETSLSYSVPTGQGTFKFSVSANKYGSISVSSITKDNISILRHLPR